MHRRGEGVYMSEVQDLHMDHIVDSPADNMMNPQSRVDCAIVQSRARDNTRLLDNKRGSIWLHLLAKLMRG